MFLPVVQLFDPPAALPGPLRECTATLLAVAAGGPPDDVVSKTLNAAQPPGPDGGVQALRSVLLSVVDVIHTSESTLVRELSQTPRTSTVLETESQRWPVVAGGMLVFLQRLVRTGTASLDNPALLRNILQLAEQVFSKHVLLHPQAAELLQCLFTKVAAERVRALPLAL